MYVKMALEPFSVLPVTLRNLSPSKGKRIAFEKYFLIPSAKPCVFLSAVQSLTLASIGIAWAPFNWPCLQHDSNNSWHEFVELVDIHW